MPTFADRTPQRGCLQNTRYSSACALYHDLLILALKISRLKNAVNRKTFMLAASYKSLGAADQVLEFGELPTPTPGSGEVRVKIAFSGVNPSDVKSRAGSRGMPFERVIPHSDGSGYIDKVGIGVNSSRIGERVWVWNAAWKRAFGTAAQYIVLPEDQAVTLHESVSMEAGACMGIPALTALHALQMAGGVQGQTVLIAGGAGSVGHYAVQMAKLMGAKHVLATVSSDAKAKLARDAGADTVINYKTQDTVALCLEASGGEGLDRIVEVDLAANIALNQAVIKPNGCMAIYGSGKAEISIPFLPSIVKNIHMNFFIVYELSLANRRIAVAQLSEWLAAGTLRHNIASTVALADIVKAHQSVEQGAVAGNVVMRID
jgi:NADPH2:quinone reductase